MTPSRKNLYAGVLLIIILAAGMFVHMFELLEI